MAELVCKTIIAVLLTPTLAQLQQCSGGDPSCPCISSPAAFNVSNAVVDGEFVVRIDGAEHTYGRHYGLHSCKAHDSNTAPYCNIAGFPSWCNSFWCYVNESDCALSALPSAYVPGLHYSYATCEATDTFTGFYTQRNGEINICSVFSEHANTFSEAADGHHRRTCGNTDTLTQVEASVAAVNALNDGRGFALHGTGDGGGASAALSRVTRHYRFNYTARSYPIGQWEGVGKQLSADLFSSDACDLIVGMANGCPDADIMAQALLANASSRIYVTGRGPQTVLRQHGDNQPYFFSNHLRSDVYAAHSMNHYYDLGARSVAIVYENADNVFYSGLGRQTLRHAVTRGFDVRYNATIDGSADLSRLEARLANAHETRSDLLVLVMREAEFRHALEVLKAMRVSHVYKALWWQGVPWGNGTCQGLADECEHAVGASQMSTEQALRGYTDPLLGITYEELQQTYMDKNAQALLFVGFPDGAMIPSMVAQAMQTLFRFREVTNPSRPLRDDLDNELLREFLRSGDLVATTFYGPVRFDKYGQNVGRDSTTQQVSGGIAHIVLPVVFQAKAFKYPAPAFADCPENAHERSFAKDDCLLCTASTCVTSTVWQRLGGTFVVSIIGGLIGVAMLVLLVKIASYHHQQYLKAIKAKQEQHCANVSRLKAAVEKVATLEFYLCFIRFDDLKAHGKLLPHEVVRAKNQLVVLDTFADVKTFIDLNQVAFISHQWLAQHEPDPEGIHFTAIVDAVTVLQQRLIHEDDPKAECPFYVWIDYISIPQANKRLQSLSISSLALYASMPDYFVVVAPPSTHMDTKEACDKESYLRRGWCRLEQWARITVGGMDDMYLWDGRLHNLSSQDNAWIHHSLRVFEGDFTDLDDPHRIVDICLGLWATAYYTHRIIVGSGEIMPQSDASQRKRSFDRSYAEHLRHSLRRISTIGSANAEDQGSPSLRRPCGRSAKTLPALPTHLSSLSHSSLEIAAAAGSAPASAKPRQTNSSDVGTESALAKWNLPTTATAFISKACHGRARASTPVVPSRRASERTTSSRASVSARTSRAVGRIVSSIASDKSSVRVSDRSSSLREYRKKRKSVVKQRTAMKASNTIYDIVSVQKDEIFPAEYFGDLVGLLEECIDDRKIVPILRSQRNAELVESRLNPTVATAAGARPRRRIMKIASKRSARMQSIRSSRSSRELKALKSSNNLLEK